MARASCLVTLLLVALLGASLCTSLSPSAKQRSRVIRRTPSPLYTKLIKRSADGWIPVDESPSSFIKFRPASDRSGNKEIQRTERSPDVSTSLGNKSFVLIPID